MTYLLVLILGTNLSVVQGFRSYEQCERIGKFWAERMMINKGHLGKPDYRCLPTDAPIYKQP